MSSTPPSESRQTSRLALQVLIMIFLILVFAATAAANTSGFTPLVITPIAARVLSQVLTPTPTVTPSRQLGQPGVSRISLPQSGVAGQTQVDAYTKALYHFDAPSGANAIDATGHFTGTLINNATVSSSGLYAGVLSVDGLNSYVRTGNLGAVPEGTIEGFVDFQTACTNGRFAIFSAVNESNGQTVLYVGVNDLIMYNGAVGLMAAIYTGGQWHSVDSGINPCRYLDGPNPPAWTIWPYETWRFHHVAVTWGARGLEIWVDGVLHGVGTDYANANVEPYQYKCNPQMQMGIGYSPPNPLYPVCQTPVMAPTMPAYPPGDYAGALPSYTTFLIGCDNSAECFKGRIDEVRISNIQRVFAPDVDPTVTPTPTQTPDRVAGPYSVDFYTQALYHLNAATGYGGVFNEVSQQWDGNMQGAATFTQTGHYNGAVAVKSDPVNNIQSYIVGPSYGASQGAVEAWLKLDDASYTVGIWGAGSDPHGSPLWEQMFFGKYYPSTPNLQFNFVSAIGNDGWRIIDSGVPASSLVGCWHHVAATWGPRGAEIWIDGVLRVRDSYTGYPYLRNYMDKYVYGCSSSGRCTSGKIDEVRISNVQRSFSPPLYGPEAERPLASGTLTFFPFVSKSSGCQYP